MWPVDLAATGADAVNAAYFSMEIGLHSDMPTYSGGLGVLAFGCGTGRLRQRSYLLL